jgi:hypothetical protein
VGQCHEGHLAPVIPSAKAGAALNKMRATSAGPVSRAQSVSQRQGEASSDLSVRRFPASDGTQGAGVNAFPRASSGPRGWRVPVRGAVGDRRLEQRRPPVA